MFVEEDKAKNMHAIHPSILGHLVSWNWYFKRLYTLSIPARSRRRRCLWRTKTWQVVYAVLTLSQKHGRKPQGNTMPKKQKRSRSWWMSSWANWDIFQEAEELSSRQSKLGELPQTAMSIAWEALNSYGPDGQREAAIAKMVHLDITVVHEVKNRLKNS